MKKELIRLFIKANKGGLVLLALVFFMTLAAAFCCWLASARYATVLVTAACTGLLSQMIVSCLYRICSMDAPMCKDWGLLGMILALILTMMVY